MFERYSSIDNHYQTKTIMRWLNEFPSLANEQFILEEKIDGANIQLYCEPGGKVQVGKRSAFIKDDESFYNIDKVLERYQPLLDYVEKLSYVYGESVRLYGELYGPGIQKRIKYHVASPELIFFDMKIGNDFISPLEFRAILPIPIVPTVAIVDSLTEALDFDTNFKSKLSDDQAEGFVIKPYDSHYISKSMGRFILKAKSDAFNEKMKVTPKEKKQISTDVLNAYNSFLSYLTENRIDNVIGNHGEFNSPKQIGDYIRYVLEDMKKDFYADGNVVSEFDKDDFKQVFNVGHKIVHMLKARL